LEEKKKIRVVVGNGEAAEAKPVVAKGQEQTPKAEGWGGAVRGLLNTGWLVRNMRFILFLALLAILYIANGHYGDKTIRQINKLSREVKELKYEHTMLKADVMFRSKESELVKAVTPLGLKTPEEPPVRLVRK
jgi:hypothetical protein